MVLSPWRAELERSEDRRMAALGTAVRREMAAEISCRQPKLVVIDARYDEDAPGGDLLAWFLQEPRFAQALAGYREERPVAYLRRFVPSGANTQGCVPADLMAITGPLPPAP
jgi:hypothetical protein